MKGLTIHTKWVTTIKKYRLRIIITIIVVLSMVVSLSGLLFNLSKSRTFQFFGGLTHRVETTEKVVALTFDDAPSPFVPEVLETLKAYDTVATFYVIGQGIEKYPEESKLIVDANMELGNHSYSHKRFLLKSYSFIETEVQNTNVLIRSTGYLGNITFRPPNGKKLFGLPMYLRSQNIKTIMWDVEPDTYTDNLEGDAKTKFLIEHTLSNTKPGSIILLHPFCEGCISARMAIGPIIEGLKSQGFKFVTVSELLKYQSQ